MFTLTHNDSNVEVTNDILLYTDRKQFQCSWGGGGESSRQGSSLRLEGLKQVGGVLAKVHGPQWSLGELCRWRGRLWKPGSLPWNSAQQFFALLLPRQLCR